MSPRRPEPSASMHQEIIAGNRRPPQQNVRDPLFPSAIPADEGPQPHRTARPTTSCRAIPWPSVGRSHHRERQPLVVADTPEGLQARSTTSAAARFGRGGGGWVQPLSAVKPIAESQKPVTASAVGPALTRGSTYTTCVARNGACPASPAARGSPPQRYPPRHAEHHSPELRLAGGEGPSPPGRRSSSPLLGHR